MSLSGDTDYGTIVEKLEKVRAREKYLLGEIETAYRSEAKIGLPPSSTFGCAKSKLETSDVDIAEEISQMTKIIVDDVKSLCEKVQEKIQKQALEIAQQLEGLRTKGGRRKHRNEVRGFFVWCIQ